MARSIILDVDTGIDDALALLLALNSPELDLVGVTCVAGNVTIDHVARNTLAVLELAGSTAPVAIGARKPLMAPLRTATWVHGSNGLGEVDLPAPRLQPREEHAVDFLVRHARERPGEITIVAVGPLTNIALAVLKDPDFATNIEGLVIMGGAVAHPGNATPAAEANFSNDPEAAAATVHCGADILLVDLGATSQAFLPLARVEHLGDGRHLAPSAQFSLRILRYYAHVLAELEASGAILHDPLAVGIAAIPDLADSVPIHLTVDTGGTISRGSSIGNFAGWIGRIEPAGDHVDLTGIERVSFNAAVARSIDQARFVDVFLDRLELR